MFKQMAIQSGEDGEQPPPDAQPSQAVPPEGSEVVEPLPPATDAVPPPAQSGGVVDGIGQIDETGSCVCSVQCDMGAYPNLEMQGVGAVGGIGGSVPMDQPLARKL